MKSIRYICLAFVFFIVGAMSVTAQKPASDDPKIEKARIAVRKSSVDTLALLYKYKPKARKAVESAAGYATFSNFGVKILVTGSGKGKGMAVNNKTKDETFMKMFEVQAGLGFGVKKFRLVFVFDTPEAFNKFVKSGWEFGGEASAAAK